MISIKSKWTPELCGGYKNFRNPQIALEIRDNTRTLTIELNRTDNGKACGMIMFLLRNVDGKRSPCRNEDILAESDYYITKSLNFKLTLDPGKFILLCCLEEKGIEASFDLTIDTAVIAKILPPHRSIKQAASWTNDKNGGHLSTRNPQFQLKVSKKGVFVIQLNILSVDNIEEGDAFMFFILESCDGLRRKSFQSSEIIGKSEYLIASTISQDIELNAGEYVIIPCATSTYTHNFELSIDILHGEIERFLPALQLEDHERKEMDCKEFLSQFKCEDNIFYDEDIAPHLLEYLKSNNGIFIDSTFPANDSSIYDTTGKRSNSCPNNFVAEWMRTNRIFDNPSMYVDGIDVRDIVQSNYLGNCWLCQGIAAAATSPDRIQELFSPNYYNEFGFYTVRLFHDGHFKYVIVDDYIPCLSDGSPAFAKSEDANEIWAMILEKAFAKVFKSYEGLTSNDPAIALTCITGGAVETDDLCESEEMWNKIHEYTNKKWVMALTSSSLPDDSANNEHEVNELGIVSNHAYSVINAFEVPSGVKLIQVRNTWGHSEWQGDWSDKSNLWTEDMKQLLRYEDKDDGIFYMSFEDMCKHFKYISFCQITADDYPNTYIVKSSFEVGQGAYSSTKNPKFTLSIKEQCKLLMRIHLAGDNVLPLRLFVCQGKFSQKALSSDEIIFESKFIEGKKLIFECTLQPSTKQYVIFASLRSATKVLVPFTLSVVSTKPLSFNEPFDDPYPVVKQSYPTAWLPCGGYMSSVNPRFKLTLLPNGDNLTSETIITLERVDEGDSVGIRIVVLPFTETPPVYLREEYCTAVSKYICTKTLTMCLELNAGTYLIIPTLQKKDLKGLNFVLEVKSSHELHLSRVNN